MDRNPVIALTVSCALLLTSCSTDHMTGSPTGTAVGAGVGAGSAVLLDASKTGIIAAGLGGAAIGYYVTSLDFASGGIKGIGGQVFSEGDFVTINIPTDNLFDTNSSELLPQSKYVLNSVIAVLNRSPDTNILISGNTSGFGTQRFQQKLSEARAREVAAYLWANGINNFKDQSNDTRKLTYVGYGNQFPIANDIRMNSLRENSRIQITAYPSKDDVGLGKAENNAFANVGGLNEPTPSYKSTTTTSSNELGNTRLSENDMSDFKNTMKENQPASSGYNETAKQQGATLPNYNSVVSAPQTTSGGNVAKQGGMTSLKGEG